MIRLVRWAISVALVQGAALLVLAQFIPGFELQPTPGVMLVALVFSVVQLISWPLVYRLSAKIHPVLFPILSLAISGALVWAVSRQLSVLNLAAAPDVESINTGIAITLGLAASYTLFGGLFSLRDIDAYDWFVTRRLRRTYLEHLDNPSPGTIFLEIDGLSAPLLQRALVEGWMPNLAAWQEAGTHELNEWETDLSSQTSASQAGILLGSNENIPAFRWYDKPDGKLRVSSNITTTRDLEHKLSRGDGLLRDGASRWNVFSGDAQDSLLTYSTIGANGRESSRGYLAMFASPYLIGRTIGLYLGDVFRESWQSFRQRWNRVEPRIRRTLRYAFVRAATTTIMMEMAQFMLLADMYRGVKTVYCTIFAYDEVAHHSGIDREDSFKVLQRIDNMIGVMQNELANAARPYRIVVLSDHGQSMGATFRHRNGVTLGELVESLLDSNARVAVHDSAVEDEGHIQLTLKQTLTNTADDRTGRVIQQALKYLPSNREALREIEQRDDESNSDAVVLASGNLGLLSFPQHENRVMYEEITRLHPMLLPGLLTNQDIGFVMVKSKAEGTLVLGNGGIHYLDDGYSVGQDPLAPYGPRAADHLRRTNGFSNAPDILIMSAFDSETGEVYAFEELVGSHGGLGGFQTRPFVFHPVEFTYPSDPVVGAESLHKVMKRWLNPEQAPLQLVGPAPLDHIGEFAATDGERIMAE